MESSKIFEDNKHILLHTNLTERWEQEGYWYEGTARF